MRPLRRIRSAGQRATQQTAQQQQGESHTHTQPVIIRSITHIACLAGRIVQAAMSDGPSACSRLVSLPPCSAVQRSTSMMPQPAGQCNAAIARQQGDGRAWTRHLRDWRGRSLHCTWHQSKSGVGFAFSVRPSALPRCDPSLKEPRRHRWSCRQRGRMLLRGDEDMQSMTAPRGLLGWLGSARVRNVLRSVDSRFQCVCAHRWAHCTPARIYSRCACCALFDTQLHSLTPLTPLIASTIRSGNRSSSLHSITRPLSNSSHSSNCSWIHFVSELIGVELTRFHLATHICAFIRHPGSNSAARCRPRLPKSANATTTRIRGARAPRRTAMTDGAMMGRMQMETGATMRKETRSCPQRSVQCSDTPPQLSSQSNVLDVRLDV